MPPPAVDYCDCGTDCGTPLCDCPEAQLNPSCCAISYAPTATQTLAPTADAGDRRRLSGARCSPPSCSAELSILLKRTLVIAAATILGFTLLHLVCFALAGAAIVVEEEGFHEKELRVKGGAHWHRIARGSMDDFLLWPRLAWPSCAFIAVAVSLQAARAFQCWDGRREAIAAIAVAAVAVAVYLGLHAALVARRVRVDARFDAATAAVGTSLAARTASPRALVASLRPAFFGGEELYDCLALGEWSDARPGAYVSHVGVLFEDFVDGCAGFAEPLLVVAPQLAVALIHACGCAYRAPEAVAVAAVAVAAAAARWLLRPFSNGAANAVELLVATTTAGLCVALAVGAVLDDDATLDKAAYAAVVASLAMLAITTTLPSAAVAARLARAVLLRARGQSAELAEAVSGASDMLGLGVASFAAVLVAASGHFRERAFYAAAATLFRAEAARLGSFTHAKDEAAADAPKDVPVEAGAVHADPVARI